MGRRGGCWVTTGPLEMEDTQQVLGSGQHGCKSPGKDRGRGKGLSLTMTH